MNKESSNLRKGLNLIAVSSLIVFIGVAFSKVLTYIYRIIIARYFGPEEYGLFSLASMVLILVVAVCSLGLPEGLVRYISFFRGKKNKSFIIYLTKYSLLLLSFIGIIAGTLLFLASEWIALNIFHDVRLISFIRIAAITVPFFILANAYLAVLRAFESIASYSFILNIAQNLGKVLALALFIFLGIKGDAIMLSYFFGIFMMFLFSAIAVKRYYSFLASEYVISFKDKDKISREILSYSWPLSLLSVASFILYWVDSFAIGYFKSAAEVGFYNAAVPLAALVMIAPDLIAQIFFPLITKEYATKNFSLIEQLSKQVTKWIFIVNVPIAIILILFPGAIINFFFGAEYLVSERALQLLAFGSLIGSLSIVPAHLISMTGRTKLMFSNMLLMLVINTILNFLLVPKYGVDGAAFSTMITFILLTFIYLIQTRHFLSFLPLRRSMLRIFLAAIPPLLIIVYAKNFFNLTWAAVLVFGIIFGILYAISVILLKCLDFHDLQILRSFSKNVKNSRLKLQSVFRFS